MPDVRFDPPVTCRIRQDQFTKYESALLRMGLNGREFRAVLVTEDGKVYPDPTCLTGGDAAATTIRGTLVQFDNGVLELLRANNIKIEKA